MDKLFRLKENNTNVRTELIAGITTFITMAYILIVNPLTLTAGGATGMDFNAVFVATALGAGLVTIMMGLFVNYPIALAPGMGLNAYFATVVISSGGAITWQIALASVFISGIIFFILTITKVRQLLLDAVPESIRAAITVGIGLFITIIGFKTSGLLTGFYIGKEGAKPFTEMSPNDWLLQLGNFVGHKEILLTIIGLLLTSILMVMRVQAAILLGIVVTTIIGIPMGVTNLSSLTTAQWVPDFSNLAIGQMDLAGALNAGLLTIVFTFTFVELFDTFGTLTGTAAKAGLLDKPDAKKRIGRAMLVDAGGVSLGALLGTSTITAYVESAAGVGQGGRTGLTSVTTGILFLLALFLAPLALVVPAQATAPALIIVGVLMMGAVRGVEWDNMVYAIPSFFTIVMMPLTSSIANGISFGIVFYVILATANNLAGGRNKIHWLMWILALLIIARFLFIDINA
ncbi:MULTISPECIES: NCS2 family permease [Aneurinibacillus]|uniref:NCS2 family permease n=1 Tax=Aneurinibacillus thermoaerophilus TaxID=143495 RepID=A0A1G8AQH1_ANETH|nr:MULTISPECIES: NCS2 family permease [Aneurinibacillus]AMA74235.1 guanine permease [Aneurinibacillus sp. XH2]MED0680979.1 NCS2 family permease [Aneurinibacillus thermoaerophilus]MED0738606.1 NCS2 family permease [Aneurinibacillus thermoaerophilus]MED0758972.1 NCS2 family permease [Aneurinibacillus thermoaerophilus]MED0762021.1 NCS2 family permease [Aneurinibacillus thermoaerophilus]